MPAEENRIASCGFTLIELAVALVIIGLILAVVLSQTGLLNSGNAIHVSSAIQDLVKLTGEFRNRYKFLPGDFPATTSELPNVATTCTMGNLNAGNGNGVVDVAETICVGEHLFRAGLIRSSAIVTKYGPVRVVARSSGLVAGHPNGVLNVIELCMIPGDTDPQTGQIIWGGVARDVDSKIDDGGANSGSILWSPSVVAPWCTNDGANPVPLMSVALR